MDHEAAEKRRPGSENTLDGTNASPPSRPETIIPIIAIASGGEAGVEVGTGVVYAVGVLVGAVHLGPMKHAVALLLLAAYAVYVCRTMKSEGDLPGETRALYFHAAVESPMLPLISCHSSWPSWPSSSGPTSSCRS